MTDTEKKKIPMAVQLVQAAQEKFTPGRDAAGGLFLVENDGANVALFERAAKEALGFAVYDKEGKVPGRTPKDDAWSTLQGGGRMLPKRKLPMRITNHEDALVIDIGDEAGRTIVVTDDKWEVVLRSPITFARTNVTMPMVEPTPGGDIDRLFEVVNVAPQHRRMFIGWLISTLFEDIAHPVMTLRGEQGAAKSTAAKVVKMLLDPAAVDSSAPPRDEDRWDSICSAHWVVSVDNVSKVPDSWSDGLCRTVTGAGIEKRALYTDDSLFAKAYQRCVILNGVSLGGMMRPDLLERSMAFDLERPTERLTDTAVNALISEVLPDVLGGLLDLAVKVMGTEVDHGDLPRMADFGVVLLKLDKVMGEPADAEWGAMAAYLEQLDELFEDSIQGDVVANAVIELMSKSTVPWHGTNSELLKALTDARRATDFYDQFKKDKKWWPDNTTQLGHALTRSAPLLRQQAGIEIESVKVGHASKRGKRITQSSTASGADSADGFSRTCVFEEEEEKGGTQKVKQPSATSATSDRANPPLIYRSDLGRYVKQRRGIDHADERQPKCNH